MKTKEGWAALVFLAILAATAIFFLAGISEAKAEAAAPSEVSEGQPGRETPAFFERTRAFTGSAEGNVNALLDRSHLFIQLYGGFQRLAGRRVIEDADPSRDVIALSDGTLTFVSRERKDPARQERAFSRLRDELAARGIPLCYVQAPNKLAPDDDRLPTGVYDQSNSYADGVLAMLKDLRIDTMDLRETFLTAPGGWASLFFSTDHHWTPEGAFLAYRTLCAMLRDKYGFAINESYTVPENFTKTVYKNCFLGSQGKRVGSLFAGVDDITAWSPAFLTSFRYEVFSQEIDRTGSFDDTLMFYERLGETDLYRSNPYTLYSGGDYPMAHITNYLNQEGPRIMLLRDSYSCALAPFLALECRELITFDLRYFGKDDRLLEYVDWIKPDIVLMMYTAGTLQLDERLQF